MRRPLARLRRRRPSAGSSPRPLLGVDVDGVVSLFGFAEPPPPPAAEFKMIDGTPHCISVAGGERLRRLGHWFDLVWVSGWEAQTEQLTEFLGLPRHPYVKFGGDAQFGSADWKLGPLASYASGRALAWVDDSFDEACYEWARSRQEPTLLVGTDSDTGLEEVHVEALVGWARSLGAERGGGAP